MPLRCVVDTNVPMTANDANPGAPAACVASSARALQTVMERGHVFLDAADAIMTEYRANLSGAGQPGPGDAFFRWLLTHEWAEDRCTHVAITPSASARFQGYQELPTPSDGTVYDPSDRKFLAVSAAHADHPPILQAFDSKWWGWQRALASIGVSIHFVCPAEIQAKWQQKMGGEP